MGFAKVLYMLYIYYLQHSKYYFWKSKVYKYQESIKFYAKFLDEKNKVPNFSIYIP